MYLLSHMNYIKSLSIELGVPYAPRMLEMVMQSDIIVLAVKPQYAAEVYPDLKLAMSKEKIIVSVMAGVTVDELKLVVPPGEQTASFRLPGCSPVSSSILAEPSTVCPTRR